MGSGQFQLEAVAGGLVYLTGIPEMAHLRSCLNSVQSLFSAQSGSRGDPDKLPTRNPLVGLHLEGLGGLTSYFTPTGRLCSLDEFELRDVPD